MDRYFYILEEDNGKKFIHLEANVFHWVDDPEGMYSEWSFYYIPLEEAQRKIKEETFFDEADEYVKYCDDIPAACVDDYCNLFFDKKPGVKLDIEDITDETPCGNYYTDVYR